MDLLKGLNDKQIEAVMAPYKPVLVLSGSGSGKTLVLTRRIAKMIRDGIDPGSILAVTFTNKAAKEMKKRISDLVGDEANRVWAGTFHGICLRILRMYGTNLGYESNFTIYDEDESGKIIKEILKDRESQIHPNFLSSFISKQKIRLIRPDEAIQNAKDNLDRELAEMYGVYSDILMSSNAMDFDDLISNVVYLLRLEPSIKDRLVSRFKHVLVDEYQDSNHSQYALIQELCTKNRSIFVVGDDFQCLAEDSILVLEDGSKRKAIDLKIGDKVQTIIKGEISFAPITALDKSKSAPICRITTESGHIMRVSENHKCFAGLPEFVDKNNTTKNEQAMSVVLYMGNQDGSCLVTFESDGQRARKQFLGDNAYKDAVQFANEIKNNQGATDVVEKFELKGSKTHLNVLPATELMPTMFVPIVKDGELKLSKIVSVEVESSSPVVDIEIASTGIVIADEVVSHNSIYAFRLADISNILNFERDYPEADVVKLEQNYRSTKAILEAGNTIIKHNKNQKEKNLWTNNPEGSPIVIQKLFSDSLEADWIASVVSDMIDDGYAPSDFAILYRSNYQSRSLERGFIEAGIPCEIVGGVRFFDRREIRDIMAYLKVISNPNDIVNLRRIINTPRRGIGNTSVERLEEFSQEKGISIFEAIKRSDEIPKIGRRGVQLEEFAKLIEGLRATNFPPYEMIQEVMEATNYVDYLHQSSEGDFESRYENIEELMRLASNFARENPEGDLSDFLHSIPLQSEVDELNEEANSVKLMTIHNSKGLEFRVVFVCGMEEGIFPHHRSITEGEIEEERRLCYVAVTRAKERLFLTCAETRQTYGGEIFDSTPSRFIYEMFSKGEKPNV